MLEAFPLIPIIAFLILLAANRGKMGFIKNRFYVYLAIVSVGWWVFLVVDQLNMDLECTPDDGLCNSGNTFWGDVTWGTMMAVWSLFYVWAAALFIGMIVHSLKSRKKVQP